MSQFTKDIEIEYIPYEVGVTNDIMMGIYVEKSSVALAFCVAYHLHRTESTNDETICLFNRLTKSTVTNG